MKYVKPLLSGILGTCVLLAGCNTLDSTMNSITSPLKAPMVQTKEHVVAFVMAIHKAEMAESKLAMVKAHHRSVKRYAHHTYKQHMMGLKRVTHFAHEHNIKPVDGMAATNVETQGKLQMAGLKMLSGNAFDKTFIDYEVKDHTAALRMIDERIQKSTDKDITEMLKKVRHHVAEHLEKAKMIQKELAR